MAIVGYARVSSVGQSLDVQKSKLEAYGCEKLFKEKLTGTTANRPQLQKMLEYVRDGDSVVITKLDRLARSTFHLTEIANGLKQKGVELIVLDQNIDTNTSTGRLLFNLLASISEFETEIRKERQLDGINMARDKGVRFGRKPKLTSTEVDEMRQQRHDGLLIRELMDKYNLSKASVYRHLQSA
jgi:DNA invertase Pin-like site-specific DNA recombinase